MTWFAAHIIQYTKFLDGVQDTYPCWENIVLIEAPSTQAARQEAEKIGFRLYDDIDPITYDNRPAKLVFAGIRKLIVCDNMSVDAPDKYDSEFRPEHGTEVTYSSFEVASDADLFKFVQGETVTVVYYE